MTWRQNLPSPRGLLLEETPAKLVKPLMAPAVNGVHTGEEPRVIKSERRRRREKTGDVT